MVQPLSPSAAPQGNIPGPPRPESGVDLAVLSSPGDYIHIWTRSGAEYWFTRTKDSTSNATHIIGVSMHSTSKEAGNAACHPRDYQVGRIVTKDEKLMYGRTGRGMRQGTVSNIRQLAINSQIIFR